MEHQGLDLTYIPGHSNDGVKVISK